MPESWKETNINAGALAAFVVGIVTIASTIIGVQWWIDNRIIDRITPIEVELKEVKQTLNDRNQQYAEIIRLLNGL